MNIIYLIIGLIIGFVVGWMMKPMEVVEKQIEKDDYLSELEKKKAENLQKMRGYIKGKEKITNGEIEKLLGVSDATTIRYLDELEKEELLKQVGKVGQAVYYEVK